MSNPSSPLIRAYNRIGLVTQIVVGLVAGCLLAWLWPEAAASVSLLGSLFVAGLKAVGKRPAKSPSELQH
jgi:serine/threonine transporter